MNKTPYKYDDVYGNRLLIRTYYGDIFLNDVINSWDNIINQGVIQPETKGVLIDYRNADLKMPIKDIEILMNYFAKTGLFSGFRFALIMEAPNQLVFPILADGMNNDFLTAPFSTEEAAKKWILKGERG